MGHEGPLLAGLAVILIVSYIVTVRFLKMSPVPILGAMILYILVALVENAFHIAFHVRDFHLDRFEWFKELRTLHYIHHLGDTRKNFFMVEMFLEGVFRTLTFMDPRRG